MHHQFRQPVEITLFELADAGALQAVPRRRAWWQFWMLAVGTIGVIAAFVGLMAR